MMDAIDDLQEPFTDDDALEAQRSIIRQSLDQIAADVGAALLKANLTFPIGITTPSTGTALLTIVTQNDPSDEEWAQASAIVRTIVSTKLDGIELCSRSLPCTMVNAPISAAEISPNTLASTRAHSASKSFFRSADGHFLMRGTDDATSSGEWPGRKRRS